MNYIDFTDNVRSKFQISIIFTGKVKKKSHSAPVRAILNFVFLVKVGGIPWNIVLKSYI